LFGRDTFFFLIIFAGKQATHMKPLLILLATVSFLTSTSTAQNEVLKILNEQVKYWNEGNLDSFMTGYWNNDSLMFVGKDEITYGYANTLNRYKKAYPDTSAMGKLKFEDVRVKKLSSEYFYVVGKWILERTAGNLHGHYTLLLRKIKGRWKIIVDHSS
jgi:ketosteroid isomerase-like protein